MTEIGITYGVLQNQEVFLFFLWILFMKSNTVSYVMGKRDNMISFRLNDDELERMDVVIKRVLCRNPHLKKAYVYRELIGVIETGMVTKDERAYLRGETELESEEKSRKTNSAFKVYTAELTMAEIAEKLTAETSVKILSEYIVFYRGSLRGDKEAIELFYELPQEVRNIIIAYYDARDSQKEEKTG